MHKGMFEDKVVIITGAASGIGRASARRFVEEGAKVCIADIDIHAAEKTAQSIRDNQGEAFACRVDISLEEDNQRMCSETIAHFGKIDVGILNAGITGEICTFLESSVANLDRVYAVNTRGCYLGLKYLGQVLQPEGAVVVVGSVTGLIGWNESAAYSASKHANMGLVRSAAKEFAAKGLRVNAVCPGVVETNMLGHERGALEVPLLPPSDLKVTPFKGVATPQQIAEFVLFLASSRASYATGGAYVVDAGLSCMLPPTPNESW